MICPKCGWVPPEEAYFVDKGDETIWSNIYPHYKTVKIKPTTENYKQEVVIWGKFYHCPEHGEYVKTFILK